MQNEKYSIDVGKLDFKMIDKLKGYMKRLIEMGGSDLHVKANSIVRGRINGEIKPISMEIVSRESALTMSKELLRGRFSEFVEQKELDFVYPYDEKVRFRVNIFFQMDGVSAVFRVIPIDILTIDELNLPSVLHDFSKKERGLVLVTGVTGSGKSTTLAAIINEINAKNRKHIITIEDPVEFIHKDQKSIVNQRSIGQDSKNFSSALRAALREDPDVILIGEMRDIETINIALHAADTGHLVFSTLHTTNAKETINRIISVFSHEERSRIRLLLGSVLQGIISQRLIPTLNGGRVAAVEILRGTPRVKDLIIQERDSEITDAITEGKEIYGSQSFDQAILDLYNEKKITLEDALRFATSATDMQLKIDGVEAEAKASNEEQEDRYDDDDAFELKV